MALKAGGTIAERYELVRQIAVGGMGEVWEARDQRLGRTVAVKVLKPEIGSDPEFLERFRTEARISASINHRNIAGVHDYGEDGGAGSAVGGGPPTAYLVMELVRGEPLSGRLSSQGKLGSVLTLDLLEQAGRALQAAHSKGFVHRDVKPGNILLAEDGTVKLTDFGIAKATAAASVTAAGMVMGTAHYIAPEQARGAEAGSVGDVYSLGVVGYECLVGHRPFDDKSPVKIAMMHINDPVPPLPTDIPINIRALIAHALVKDPARRYGDGGEFAAAVAAVRRGQSPPTPGSPPSPTSSLSTPVSSPLPTASSGVGTGPRPVASSGPHTPPPSGPRPVTPSGPQPVPSSGPQPVPSSGPHPVPSSGPHPVPSSGPHPVPSSGPQPVPSSGPHPAVSVPPPRTDTGDRVAPASDGFAVAGLSAPGLPPLPGRMRPLPSPNKRRLSGLTVVFALLTAAAVTLGVLVVRHAVGADTPAAGPTGVSDSAPAAPPAPADTAETGPAPAGSVLVDLAAYAGRPASAVDGELRGVGLLPTTRTTAGQVPAVPASCTVTDISPAGAVRTGTAVTITCAPH
jgi:serine/threonine-protein kinase